MAEWLRFFVLCRAGYSDTFAVRDEHAAADAVHRPDGSNLSWNWLGGHCIWNFSQEWNSINKHRFGLVGRERTRVLKSIGT